MRLRVARGDAVSYLNGAARGLMRTYVPFSPWLLLLGWSERTEECWFLDLYKLCLFSTASI